MRRFANHMIHMILGMYAWTGSDGNWRIGFRNGNAGAGPVPCIEDLVEGKVLATIHQPFEVGAQIAEAIEGLDGPISLLVTSQVALFDWLKNPEDSANCADHQDGVITNFSLPGPRHSICAQVVPGVPQYEGTNYEVVVVSRGERVLGFNLDRTRLVPNASADE